MKQSQVLLTIAITYFTISMLEYVLHSKVMHGNPDTLRRVPIVGNIMAKTAEHHLAHHMEVRMDMKLEHKTDVSGLIFGWETSLILLGLQFGLMMSLKRFTKLSTKSTAIVSLSIMVGYCFLWNSIHLDMHRVSHNVSVAQGVPNMPNTLSRGFVYRYLWKYHAIHHLQKGGDKGNFNIVLPGFDHLMGTFRGFCFDNTEYCRETKDARCKVRMKDCVRDSEIHPRTESTVDNNTKNANTLKGWFDV